MTPVQLLGSLYIPCVFVVAGAVWHAMKRAAAAQEQPEWWDLADGLVGIVVFLPTFLVNLSADLPTGAPVMAALVRSTMIAVWAIGAALIWGLWIEVETDWLDEPDDLAPPAARARGTVRQSEWEN